MSFRLLSWNVHNLRGGGAHLGRVTQLIRDADPHVFGLFEVAGADVLELMREGFPGCQFAITQGRQQQEILVGWWADAFDQAIFTQKREFRAYNPYLRPGAFLSVRIGNQWTNMLFLHTDSGTEPRDFGNRFEMFDHIWNLKRSLDRRAGPRRNGRLIVLGDLNTMGLQYPTRRISHRLVDGPQEIRALDNFASRRDMTVLAKDHAHTWRKDRPNRTPWLSDLDHVVASEEIRFRGVGTSPNGEPAFVNVEGWNQLSGSSRSSYLRNISDHSSLLVTVL